MRGSCSSARDRHCKPKPTLLVQYIFHIGCVLTSFVRFGIDPTTSSLVILRKIPVLLSLDMVWHAAKIHGFSIVILSTLLILL